MNLTKGTNCHHKSFTTDQRGARWSWSRACWGSCPDPQSWGRCCHWLWQPFHPWLQARRLMTKTEMITCQFASAGTWTCSSEQVNLHQQRTNTWKWWLGYNHQAWRENHALLNIIRNKFSIKGLNFCFCVIQLISDPWGYRMGRHWWTLHENVWMPHKSWTGFGRF